MLDCKGGNSPASSLSFKDKKVFYEARARLTPGHNLRRRRRMVSLLNNLFDTDIDPDKSQANVVQPAWTGMSASAQQGMRNLTGVLCYRSALLQSLFHQPQFCLWLTKYHEPQHCIWSGAAPCVACVLRNLVRAYWSGDKKSVNNAYIAVDKAFRASKYNQPLKKIGIVLIFHRQMATRFGGSA